MENSLKRLGFGLVLTVTTLMPMSALAYISPQDLWGSSEDPMDNTVQTARFTEPVKAPPNMRGGEQAVADQQARAAAQREAAQSTLTPANAEPVDTYVATEEEISKPSLLNNDTNYELRQKRMAESKADGPTIIIAGAGVTVDSNGKILHSGAPLVTSTGPETTLALAVMILAAISTFAFTFTRGRIMHASLPEVSL